MSVLGIITRVGQQGTVNKIPVDEECTLQGIDYSTRDAHVSVAPRPTFHTFYITHGDIHAADEARLSVDDAKLPMIAIVHFARQCREPYRNEGPDFDTLAFHSVEELIADIPATHVVIDNPHFNALPHLVYQGIGNEHSECVVVDNVGIDMNMMPCASDGME